MTSRVYKSPSRNSHDPTTDLGRSVPVDFDEGRLVPQRTPSSSRDGGPNLYCTTKRTVNLTISKVSFLRLRSLRVKFTFTYKCTHKPP